MKRTLFAAAALFTLTALGGCAGHESAAELNVHRDSSDVDYTATFDRAMFAQSPAGQVDIILLQTSGGEPSVDHPLSSDGDHGVKQIVHMKVLWNPTRTIRLDSPSASNAFIDWHVMAGESNRVTYNGSCWAMVSTRGDTASIDLRNATVTISQIVGKMQDPLKRAQLSGVITAQRCDGVVQSYLTELAALDHKTATALSGPTARAQTTP